MSHDEFFRVPADVADRIRGKTIKEVIAELGLAHKGQAKVLMACLALQDELDEMLRTSPSN